MTLEHGKYDDLCTHVRERANATAAIVVVIEGSKGSGFSVQTKSPLVLLALPGMLRHMADEIDGDVRRPGDRAPGKPHF